MRRVRPLHLVLTASLTAAAVAIALQPQGGPQTGTTSTPPEPIDTLVAAAEPGAPASIEEQLGISRVVRPIADTPRGQIPVAALAAYQRAATVAAKVDKDCGITWTLVAAIGGVESDHGRSGGAKLGADGVSKPLIRGVTLDGHGRVAKVADTDAGRVDGNKRWDRAVGPMQFLPSTWATVGVDADGDGTRSADDIDDAALGTAVFLCAVPGDLTDRAGLRAALLRYNPSSAYVADVIALEREYRTGAYAPPEVTPISSSVVASARIPGTVSSQDATGQQGQQNGSKPGKDVGSTSGAGPADHAGEHWQEPEPPAEPEPEPEPEPQPEDETVTGALTSCGTEQAPAWCLDGATLDLGDADYLAAAALADFDGDGAVETNAEELTGLTGTEVTLVVQRAADAAPVVLAIGGLDYVVRAAGGSAD